MMRANGGRCNKINPLLGYSMDRSLNLPSLASDSQLKKLQEQPERSTTYCSARQILQTGGSP